jgi:hypothetical protein
MLVFAVGASAARHATRSEFRAIERVVERQDGGFYCATRDRTRVSTRNRRWAVAAARSNCGLGSQTALYFLRHSDGRWRVRQRRYERAGSGQPIPCGRRPVPRDIRCGPR